jgi:hypothetical protein
MTTRIPLALTVLLVLSVGAASSQTPTATQVGSGCVDSNGRVAVLSTTQLPAVGNLAFNVDVTMGSPGAGVLIFWSTGLEPAPIPLGGGCSLYLEFLTMILVINQGASPIGPVFMGPTGALNLPIPIPNIPNLVASHVVLQAAVLDPALTLGFTTTNALDLLLF